MPTEPLQEAFKARWVSHFWDKRIVSHLLRKSQDTIKLRVQQIDEQSHPTEDDGNVIVFHKELLCFYSPYFRALLKSGFADSKKEVLDVQTTYKALSMLADWTYMGDINTRELCSQQGYADVVEFYIFADCYDFLAIRREIVGRLAESDYQPSARLIEYTFSSLPESDPLCAWMVETHVQHYAYGATDKVKNWIGVQPEFLAAVMLGKANLERLKGERSDPRPMIACSCCARPPCNFHAHESELEREATCGGNKDKVVDAYFTEQAK